MFKVRLRFLFLWLVLLTRIGYAETKPGLVVRDAVVSGERVTASVVVTNFPDPKPKIKLQDIKSGIDLPATVHPEPMRLWLLIDTSGLCVANRVDAYLTALLAELRRALHPKSQLSLVTFSGAGTDVLLRDEPVKSAESVSLKCDPKQVSSSYEPALRKLMERSSNDDENVAVWVYTSGNIQLSDQVQDELSNRSMALHLILYNAILEPEIRPLVNQANLKVGRDRIQMSVFNPEAKSLPERWYRMEFDSPLAERWNTVPLEAVLLDGDKEIAKQLLTVTLPQGGKGSFYQRYGRWLLLALGIALVLTAITALYRYYRAKKCPKCRRTMRYSDVECLWCQEADQAFLLGKFNEFDRYKQDKWDCVPIGSGGVELGTQRKHRVRLAKQRLGSKGVAARIEVESKDNLAAYRLVPLKEGLPVTVNGRRVTGARYLAKGDRIELSGLSFYFHLRRKKYA